MKKEVEIWYAVSKTGQGRVFTERPERNEHFGVWTGCSFGSLSSFIMFFESEGFVLPYIKWRDDPVKITLTLEYQHFNDNER